MNAVRPHVAKLLAAVLILGSWYFAGLPAASAQEQDRLVRQFAFRQLPINSDDGPRDVRRVAPAYQDIDHWISSVGAAVALADLDGNTRPDEVCLVDPRDDSVTLRPVPGTDSRLAPLVLRPHGLPYDHTMAPMGCTPGDYNEDGRLDVLVYYWGRSPIIFLRAGDRLNAPAAAFVPQELVEPYQVWNTNAVTLGDFDGDGHVDIVVGNYFPDGAPVLDPAAGDDDRLQMQRSMSDAANGGANYVMLHREGIAGDRPAARFVMAASPFSDDVDHGWTLALGSQDLDADGLPELYVANDFGPDWLLHNLSEPGHVRFRALQGVRHLSAPKSKVLGNDSFKGMGVGFTDLNHDDIPDMVVSNITKPYALLESNFAWVSTRRPVIGGGGTAYYDDHSEPLGISRSGWGWDIKAADFAGNGEAQILQATGFIAGEVNRWAELQELAMTNDDLLSDPRAWPDFHPGDDIAGHDPNPFFVRGPGGRFVDIAQPLGVDDPGPSRGIALADVDHDGRLDFAVANQWRQSYFYRNVRNTDRPYLGLRLLMPAAGGADCAATSAGHVPAIGASVLVQSGGVGIRTGQVYPANGHAGVSAPELSFALMNRNTRAKVTVSWRDRCGRPHRTQLTLNSGWHSLVLAADGSTKEVTS